MSKKSYKIDDISFDRNPTTQSFNSDGEGTITLYDYYKKYKGILLRTTFNKSAMIKVVTIDIKIYWIKYQILFLIRIILIF